MKTESVNINKLKLNPANPRTFTEYNINDMVKSLICFPEMYKIRPMAIADNVPIGGNLRLKAFKQILTMKLDDIGILIADKSKDKSKERVEFLIDYWSEFQTKKQVEIVNANDLTPEQRREFIIRDNISLGSFDYDMLANSWEVSDLKEWGVQLPVWGDTIEDLDSFFENNNETNDKKPKLCPHCGKEL